MYDLNLLSSSGGGYQEASGSFAYCLSVIAKSIEHGGIEYFQGMKAFEIRDSKGIAVLTQEISIAA